MSAVALGDGHRRFTSIPTSKEGVDESAFRGGGPRIATTPEPSLLLLLAVVATAGVVLQRRRTAAPVPDEHTARRTLMKKTRNLVLAATLMALWCERTRAQMTFTPIGRVGGPFAGAYDVSADGSVVVGQADFASGPEAFRWTRDGAMVGLGDLPGGIHHSAAYGVSADGSVVVGHSSQEVKGLEFGDWGAFRWTSAGGMVPLGRGTAWDVSADGSVVVGDAAYREAFRWTPDGGMVGLGRLPGEPGDSNAVGVSADGSVVVGFSSPYAFRWTSGGRMVRLNDLSGASFDGRANSVSADGSVIVGVFKSDPEAFRWTSDGGMLGLGQLPGGGYASAALDVSADGSVVVGSGRTAASDVAAFLWTSDGGMRDLRELLIQNGATGLTGWTLTTASAITPDGRTIVGTGTNPLGLKEAWIATVPEPSSLLLLGAATAGVVSRPRRARRGVA
jgi:probable HAF family extracellular repeat protein